jgi:hypothetical protein
MSDPYRGQRAAKLEALLGEEREMLVRAGKLMVVAGVLAVLAVVVGLPTTLRGGAFDWIADGIPAVLGALTLQAGLVLSRLPGGSRDYGHIERALGSLRIVYAVKAVIMLLVVGLMCLALIAPMVLRFF